MRSRRGDKKRSAGSKAVDSQPRVIGGELRGRIVRYNGDPNLRPMKDRVRESLFNLIGPRVVGKQVVDLFAGTGAMAIEAISRRAMQAICIERRFPNAKTITETVAELGLQDRIHVLAGDAFHWVKRLQLEPTPPWLVFCCPPYEFYISQRTEMLNMLDALWQTAPPETVFVVECDNRFPTDELPHAEAWQVREYAPAVLAIAEKSE